MENNKTTPVHAFVPPASQPPTVEKGGEKMRKFAIQVFIIGTIIATYALPVLARGGGGP
jgi:hypothetical protein